MKLSKSIEKAKQQRLELLQRMAGSGSEAAFDQVPPAPAEPESQFPVNPRSRDVKPDLKKMGQNRIVCMFPDIPETEYYKVLRTNILQRIRGKNWNTVMITSVQPGEGKTLTAINLAVSFAREFDQTVLLVDMDLKRQNIFRYLNLPGDRGIIDYLTKDILLQDIMVRPNIDKLVLISGGKTTRDSAELVGSPKMKALVQEIKNRYDDRYVIFDTPPILSGADAIAFAPMADCIVLVVEEGRTSVQDIQRALELIPKEKFLGFVLNRRKFTAGEYYYY
jgi:protein-tyrosine kinase